MWVFIIRNTKEEEMKEFRAILESKGFEKVQNKDLETFYGFLFNNTKIKELKQLVDVMRKYLEVTNKLQVDDIITGNIRQTDTYEISVDDMKVLKALWKQNRGVFQILPQFLTPLQRDLVMRRDIPIDDIVLDITSMEGRNRVVKKFNPLMIKVINQWYGKCPLDKSELMSASMVGLTSAMNTYDPFNFKDGKHQSFVQYAAYQIRYQILIDINQYSKTISQSEYLRNKYGDVSTFSIDSIGPGPDDTIDVDRIIQLSDSPENTNDDMEEKRYWEEVYDKLEKKFSLRDCEIFYRVMGLRDRKKETGREIAKEFSVTSGFISQTVKKILNFMTTDKDSYRLLTSIHDMYIESLVLKNYEKKKEDIEESLLGDDIYIMVEEMMRWIRKEDFEREIRECVEGKKEVRKCLTNENYMNENYRVVKPQILEFLSILYPTTCFEGMGDNDIIEEMEKLKNMVKVNNITL